MTWYLYPVQVAVDQNGTLLYSGTFSAYSETDAVTPLSIRDINDQVIGSVAVNEIGLTQSFRLEVPEAILRSGDFATAVASSMGMRLATEAAADAAATSAAAATASAAAAIAPTDETVAGLIAVSSATQAAADLRYPTLAKQPRNILDYGVVRGTSATQTVAIKTALDSHPGEAFRFPPGDYRLDTTLVVGAANSLIFDDGARVYAGAAMTYLIDWTWAGASYAEDKGFIGGLLDGALLADYCLRINKVLRFTLTQVTMRDGVRRGLFTGPTGAELMGSNLRIYNTTISNVADNIGIESTMGDCHFTDILMRDVTVAVKDTMGNRWTRVHPWIGPDIGAVTQMTSRYPTSVAFDLTGASDLDGCVSDTYRTGIYLRSNGIDYTAPPRLLNVRATWSSTTLPADFAIANPGTVIDNSAGVGAFVDRMSMTGHSGAPVPFLTGTSALLTARSTVTYGYITGALEYLEGVEQGNATSWTPTLYGTTGAGTHVYTIQTGRVVIRNGLVTYLFRVKATCDATGAFAGSLRIGGAPLPPGATGVRDGAGAVGVHTGVAAHRCVIYAGTSAIIYPLTDSGASTLDVDIPGAGLRGTVVEILGSVTCTYYRS